MIQIQDLHYQYPDGTAALRGINLTIPSGEFLLVCGANGSGKTTLMRHINGLLRPSSGTVLVDGLDTRGAQKRILQLVGMVFQEADSQIVGETVREDIAFGPENLGLQKEAVSDRVRLALAATGMEDVADRSCDLLSGGQKRRLAIAGVLAMEPRVLVFDEPFANLDFGGTRQAIRQILRLHAEGHTIILTTHDVEKVIAHVDRVAVLFKGELKLIGDPEEIIPHLLEWHIRPPCYSLLGGKAVSWLDD